LIVATKNFPGQLPTFNCRFFDATIFPVLLTSAGDRTMDLRELKALEIAARCRIVLENGVWSVPSQTSPTTRYRVTLSPASCTCEDFQLRGPVTPCKHVIAARLVFERDGGNQAPAIVTDAVPGRLT